MSVLIENISKSFKQGVETLNILNNVNVEIKHGNIVSLVGASGTGKSTLLHLIGLLDTPSSGSLYIDGCKITSYYDKEKTLFRRKNIGFVYQFHYLLQEFTALENVIIPQLINNVSNSDAKNRAIELLTRLGLEERIHHIPKKLSGGEQQRVAIARAIANNPKVLLADEPTGNLDPDTTKLVFSEMLKIIKENNITTIIATHDYSLANTTDRIIKLKNCNVEECDKL